MWSYFPQQGCCQRNETIMSCREMLANEKVGLVASNPNVNSTIRKEKAIQMNEKMEATGSIAKLQTNFYVQMHKSVS